VIAIDTNVLVRYLTADDPGQLARVRALFATLSTDSPGFICRETLLELVWVLGYSYGFGRGEICDTLDALLSAIELEIEDAEVLSAAIDPYLSTGADFADLMIRGAATKRGALPLMTFDAVAARLDGVELVT
jgi:predicted nucleic-acid-binding protein